MEEIDRQTVPSGEAERSRRRPLGAPAPGEVSRATAPGRRAAPRPRGRRPPTAAAGTSRACSAGLAEAEPEQRRRVEQRRMDEERQAIAAAPATRLAQAGASRTAARAGSPRRCSAGCRTRSSARARNRASAVTSAAAPATIASRLQNAGRVQPVAMGERQRHAHQRQERACDAVRQKPHRRREGQHRRDQPEVGEIPDQVIGRHPDQREAAREVDRVDAARFSRRVGRRLLRRSRRGFEQRVVENELALELDRPGHQHVVVRGPPFDHEFAARQADRRLRAISPRRDAATPASRRRPNRRRASARRRAPTPAPLTSSRAMISAKVTLAFSGNIGWASILAPQAAASIARKIGDEERRVRVAHVDGCGGAQRREAVAFGPVQRRPAACPRPRARSGMSAQPSRGAPMSTR